MSPVYAKASSFQNLSTFCASERVATWFKDYCKRHGLPPTADTAIFIARTQSDDKAISANRSFQAIHSAADLHNLIRYDFDGITFAFGRLYHAINKAYDGFLPQGLHDFKTNLEYELYGNLSAYQIATVNYKLKQYIDEPSYAILSMHFGLSLNSVPIPYNRIARIVGLSQSRVRDIVVSSLARLRWAHADLPALYAYDRAALFNQATLKKAAYDDCAKQWGNIIARVKELEAEAKTLSDLYHVAFCSNTKTIFGDNPQSSIQKNAGAAPSSPAATDATATPDTTGFDDRIFTSIYALGLSNTLASRLARNNMMTLADILTYPDYKFMRIRNFGKKSAEELTAKMHELGYADFVIT
ncbi:hypothetical protein IJG29_02320 [Candidatus Saccharibacteria bacterium]|nr:hypothetical protein [Candidatus Saccharibacteria bacterium]